MNLIEKCQKQALFEEASKKSILASNLLSFPEIFNKLVGVTDIGVQNYGVPLTPIYNAISGSEINISKFGNYFVGLSRDLYVMDLANTFMENSLLQADLEMWARTQKVKMQASHLEKLAEAENSLVANGSTWSYTETFHTTNNIDMLDSTVWINTSEGSITLPSNNNLIVKPSQITVKSQSLPTGGDFLGSDPSLAFDGMPNTNWRCQFIKDDGIPASCTITFDNPLSINSISIDPVGFGINLTITYDDGTGFKPLISQIIYQKITFPFTQIDTVQSLIVSFTAEGATLPKVGGIRDMIISTAQYNQSADFISTALTPSQPFSQIYLDIAETLPPNTQITSFFSIAGSSNWVKFDPDNWYPINNSISATLDIDPTTAVAGYTINGQSYTYNGLFGIPLTSLPLSIYQGDMEIGREQVEVSAFFKDYSSTGTIPYLLNLNDFNSASNIKKTWGSLPYSTYNPTSLVMQPFGQSVAYTDSNIQRGGTSLIFQRVLNINDNNISSADCLYRHMTIIPLLGSNDTNYGNNAMQYSYNYKISFKVYALQSFSYSGAKYWFLQGFRIPGQRSYTDIGKSYCSVSMYINGNPVIRTSTPATIYSDNTIVNTISDTPSPTVKGIPFNLNLQAGENVIDILINVTDASLQLQDNNDNGNPYVQFSFTPSIFDSSFRNNPDYNITEVIASGHANPVSEFDLLWNLPIQMNYWAYSEDRQNLLFNTNKLTFVDPYFRGVAPACRIVYNSTNQTLANDLYLKLNLSRESDFNATALVSKYTVMVN